MTIREHKQTSSPPELTSTIDREAFAREYQAAYRRLWLLAAGLLGTPSMADDLVQEAAIVAFHRLDQYRDGSSFSAWLSEIVKRLAQNYRRKAARRKTYATSPDELDQQPQPGSAQERTIGDGLDSIADDLQDEILRVMRQIPDEPRCCMLLRVIDGLSYAEISAMLGIPEGTAMSHVHRAKSFARQRLRDSFQDGKGLG